MKLTPKEFKKLQNKWYRCLEREGFNDIEKKNSFEGFRTYPAGWATDIACKTEYFSRLYHAVNDENTVFRNELDKYILTRYANGARINTIMNELNGMGESLRRNSLRFIIRKYEIAWKVRNYLPNQLNIYKASKDD